MPKAAAHILTLDPLIPPLSHDNIGDSKIPLTVLSADRTLADRFIRCPVLS